MLWILRTVLLVVVWVVLVVALSVSFTVSYMRIVPTSQHHVDLHFDFVSTKHAQAVAQFPAMLRAGQQYRVALELVVPDIVGSAPNFMVKARLAHGPRVVHDLGLLRRRSWFVEIAFKASRLPLYLLSVLEETRTDMIVLTESFRESAATPVTSVTVDMMASAESERAKVPECFASRLVFAAQLTIIQSLLVRYRFVLFVTIVLGGASLITFVIALVLVIKQLNQVGSDNHIDYHHIISDKESSDSQYANSLHSDDDSDEYSAEEQLVPLL